MDITGSEVQKTGRPKRHQLANALDQHAGSSGPLRKLRFQLERGAGRINLIVGEVRRGNGSGPRVQVQKRIPSAGRSGKGLFSEYDRLAFYCLSTRSSIAAWTPEETFEKKSKPVISSTLSMLTR